MSRDAQSCVGAESLLSPIRGCVLWLSFGKLKQVADKEVIAVVLFLSLCSERWILGHVCGFGV